MKCVLDRQTLGADILTVKNISPPANLCVTPKEVVRIDHRIQTGT